MIRYERRTELLNPQWSWFYYGECWGVEKLRICGSAQTLDSRLLTQHKGQFSTTQSCFFSSIQLRFCGISLHLSLPFLRLLFLSECFPSIFLVFFLPPQPGLLWWREFLHSGRFFCCFFPLPPFLPCCLLSFVLDWLQTLCKGMQPLFCFFFPCLSLKGWGGEAAMCVYWLPLPPTAQGGGWDLAKDGQVSFFFGFIPTCRDVLPFHPSLLSFCHLKPPLSRPRLAFIISISSPLLSCSPLPYCLSSSAHSSTHPHEASFLLLSELMCARVWERESERVWEREGVCARWPCEEKQGSTIWGSVSFKKIWETPPGEKHGEQVLTQLLDGIKVNRASKRRAAMKVSSLFGETVAGNSSDQFP